MVSIRKIGIFGGTFDPIHFGHLNLATSILEARGLDEVWFCPAWISPHKQAFPPSDPLIRKEMVKAAIQDYPAFSLLDVELSRKGP